MKTTYSCGPNGINVNYDYDSLNLLRVMSQEDLDEVLKTIHPKARIDRYNIILPYARSEYRSVSSRFSKQALIDFGRSQTGLGIADNLIKMIPIQVPYAVQHNAQEPLHTVPGCCGASYLNSTHIKLEGIDRDYWTTYYSLCWLFFYRVLQPEELIAFSKFIRAHFLYSIGDTVIHHKFSMIMSTDSSGEPRYNEVPEEVGRKIETGIVNRKTDNRLNTYAFNTEMFTDFYKGKMREYFPAVEKILEEYLIK